MTQEQVGLKRFSSIGIVAAFGIMTMTSNCVDNPTTMSTIKPSIIYETSGYAASVETVCSSSMLLKQAIGDIVMPTRLSDYNRNHKKLSVNLQVTKIKKHISFFEFEDEFEEL